LRYEWHGFRGGVMNVRDGMDEHGLVRVCTKD
jgi:hypothetical protein